MEKSIASLIKCKNILERDHKYINKILKGNYPDIYRKYE